MSFLGISFGKKKDKSSSSSTSTDSVFQSDIFSRLFSGAEGVAGGINTAGLTQAANDLFQQGSGFLSGLSDIASGNDPTGQYLQGRVNGVGSTANDQVSQLKADLDAFFNENLLPGITSDAAGAGQLGGGRQGVAQAGAVGQVARAFSQGATQIRTQDLAQRDAIAQQLQQQQAGAAQAGLNFLPQQFGLAQSGSLAALSPYLALGQVLGGPTVLNQSQSKSKGKSSGFDIGI